MRVRFAPSPTGHLHVGGTFIVRIEDAVLWIVAVVAIIDGGGA